MDIWAEAFKCFKPKQLQFPQRKMTKRDRMEDQLIDAYGMRLGDMSEEEIICEYNDFIGDDRELDGGGLLPPQK